MSRRGKGRVQGGWSAAPTPLPLAAQNNHVRRDAPTSLAEKPVFMRARTRALEKPSNKPPDSQRQSLDSPLQDCSCAGEVEGPSMMEAGREESCLETNRAQYALDERANNMTGTEAESCLRTLLVNCKQDVTECKRSKAPILVWLRQDLRVEDNPALHTAAETGRPIIPIFIHCPPEEENWNYGAAAKLWLHGALEDLAAGLARDLMSKLVIRYSTDSLSTLLDLVLETGATALFFNRVYEPWKIRRDAVIAETLACNGLAVYSFKGVVLYEPLEVFPDSPQGRMHGFGSVGFFLNACEGKEIGDPLPVPSRLRSPKAWPSSDELSSLGLTALPLRKDGTAVDWTVGIQSWWRRGEAGAKEALHEFVHNGCFHFEGRERFRADKKYTAVISPYVRFGQLSPRSVIRAVAKRHGQRAKTFMRRLAWRDLAYWCLWKFPHMADAPLRPHYRFQTWDAPRTLAAWQYGQTGFPLVDAAMRQLWVTGWMPNYMRHVVAGMLVEHMNVHWLEGERWFHDTLVDADVAINAYMWQNGGHSGLDQWNFVMHPVYAAKSCDPDGDYTRQWVPELAGLPSEYIHCPWEAPLSLLSSSRISLMPAQHRAQPPKEEEAGQVRRLRAAAMQSMPGASPSQRRYPHRIITDLEGARRKSLEAVLAVRRGPGRAMVLPSGHESMRLEDGSAVVLITRKDYREMSAVPITNQTPDESRDPRRRPRRDPLSLAMADTQAGYDRMLSR